MAQWGGALELGSGRRQKLFQYFCSAVYLGSHFWKTWNWGVNLIRSARCSRLLALGHFYFHESEGHEMNATMSPSLATLLTTLISHHGNGHVSCFSGTWDSSYQTGWDHPSTGPVQMPKSWPFDMRGPKLYPQIMLTMPFSEHMSCEMPDTLPMLVQITDYVIFPYCQSPFPTP